MKNDSVTQPLQLVKTEEDIMEVYNLMRGMGKVYKCHLHSFLYKN